MDRKTKRRIVYEKYKGHCAYCGEAMAFKQMQVDHFIPKYIFKESIDRTKNGETKRGIIAIYNPYDSFIGVIEKLNDINNLMPACRQCNFYKDTHSIEAFRRVLSTVHERLRKPFIFRLALKYSMVELKKWDKLFYFER